tara:strand:+ start:2289 stop:2678 length:390 start_codon:yes stop_codon:yes gene_type:complete
MLETKYVIHRHLAKTAGEHWDLRIKKGPVLKSWAIPKHRMPEKGERLYAIQTPDHSLVWYNFKGTIEDGYGKGKVEIFEQGKCNILFWGPKKIIVEFFGIKIKGKYILIRMEKFDKGNQKASWLIIKGK